MSTIYIVYVTIPFGVDDTLYCEYSGIEHYTIEDAKLEELKAKNDSQVIYTSIEVREVLNDN